ncbi:hypothetical protein E5676_scaffold216G001280 [Cucumis melo var. makuwa]|uniref:Uncharacterized protein n=1 Tax=Cucumis melo var. makuwa TaxID=1194695 RepID=A0A5A7UV80_CUCMM|nr:hypothetical protein E6C27_scaffold280G003230 [Cucumis melo var. makuwa]TYK30144.1 hypothetical protein E5676_scaffold216G001280 [Cucumis melo var. makuwa]
MLCFADDIIIEVADEEIAIDLHNVEVKIDDENVALIFLTFLPPSYETFIDSYIGGKETITLEDTKSMLLMREDHQNAESLGIESQAYRVEVDSEEVEIDYKGDTTLVVNQHTQFDNPWWSDICLQGSEVVLRGTRCGTLYLLSGSTITGYVDVTSSTVHKDDMAKLWHIQHGHMSEKGMRIL